MDIFEDFDAAYGKGCYTSMSDGLGGENIMHDGMVVGHEAPMGTMSPEGTLRILNHEGGTDVLEGGQVQSHSVGNAMGGNVDAITQYDNPLAHSAECRFAPFDAAKTL